MTAISKAWTVIADAAIDPDSPITTGLMTGLRNNAIHVREWLGASYTAGAVQDHDHDGINSARLEIGPNALRNGSFESGETGWTFTDYSGGSHAQESSNDMHGANSMAFTSTVLANGGGYALSNEFIAIAQGDVLPWSAHLKASVANISARLEIIWYDDAQSQISATQLVNVTSAPTAATQYSGMVTAVSTARFFKIRITGGVPAAGSATGTIYFDGIRFSNFTFPPNSIGQSQIGASAVGQSQIGASAVGQGELKAASGEISAAITTPTVTTLPGGNYGFWPSTRNSSNADSDVVVINNILSSTYGARITMSRPSAGTVYATQYYIQASPPYDLGNGAVPRFLFAGVDTNGNPIAGYSAEDPPWANNGPTNIRPDFYRRGIGYKRRRAIAIDGAKLANPAQREAHLRELAEAPIIEVEVDAAFKNSDMGLIPHPFGPHPDIADVILIEPVGKLVQDLADLERVEPGVSIQILHDYLTVDNVPIAGIIAPPGVVPIRARWRNNP